MSVKRCGNCGHPVYRHDPEGEELCGQSDCTCPGFLTVRKGGESPFTEAVAMVQFAHHSHPFGDEHCNPLNCSVSEWLTRYARLAAGPRP